MAEFRWNQWNEAHIAEHGVDRDEVEYVVKRARRPFPEHRDDAKWLVWGQAPDGRYLQVVYIHDPDGTIYVIHAMPLTVAQKRRFRRRRK